MTARPQVVIVGGGFGGLEAAKALAKLPVNVTLVDRRNHHLFQPLLYQVATAGLSAPEIAMPIRKVLRRHPNVRVLLAEATGVDKERRRLILEDGALDYDFLIVATGATHDYFGHDDWEHWAPGLKTIEDAFEVRRRIFSAFEAAERTEDLVERAAWLTFVVVGAGPTGMELAGAISEIARSTLVGDFRRFDPRSARVVLVEGANRVLPAFPFELSDPARRQLKHIGVEVMLEARVTAIDREGVEIQRGTQRERMAARTVLWAAGIKASPLGRALGVPIERGGQVKVTPSLSIPGHEEIFVIGDLASLEIDGRRVPPLAPAAMQMGKHTAQNIQRKLWGLPPLPFRYVDRGIMATIGRKAAVASVGNLRLTGFIAWLAWLLIHILLLIGFRNRMVTMINWIWAYFTFQRQGRLILETAAEVERRQITAPAPRPPTDGPSEPSAPRTAPQEPPKAER